MLITQIVGCLGVLVSLAIFQSSKRKNILKLSLFASLIYTVHYILLGAFTGAAMNFVGATRAYIYFEVKPDRRHIGVLMAFVGISILATLITWHGLISLLPLLSSISGSIAFWQKKPKNIRRWALIGPPLWFTYNAIVGSYPGMIIDTIMFISNLVGEYRLDFHHKKQVKRRLAHAV